MENKLIIAGSGGQGVLFLGNLIVYSCLRAGKNVTCFPSYGAEMRGGTANCTIIISDDIIGSPVTKNPDMLVVMNEESLKRFSKQLLPGGTLIYDASLINPAMIPANGIKTVKVHATEISASLKDTKSANMALMGAFTAVAGILDIDSVLQTLEDITPPHRKNSLPLNKKILLKAFKET